MLRIGSLFEQVGGGFLSGGAVLVGGGSTAMVLCGSRSGENMV